MPDIRVALKLQRFSLEYGGSLAFFERVIDPLLVNLAPYPGREPQAVATSPRTAQQRLAPERAAAAAGPRVAGEDAAAASVAVPRGYRPTSPEFGAFIQKLGPEAGEPDRQILAFAFYLWNYEKKDRVRETEIESCFRALGLEPPREAARLYADLFQRLRFLQPGEESGTWTLTTKGANYVRTRLLGTL